jgi:hypothetical protein
MDFPTGLEFEDLGMRSWFGRGAVDVHARSEAAPSRTNRRRKETQPSRATGFSVFIVRKCRLGTQIASVYLRALSPETNVLSGPNCRSRPGKAQSTRLPYARAAGPGIE